MPLTSSPIMFSKIAMVLFSFLSLQGCALQLLDWVTPATGYQAKKNVAYADLPRQKLDIYTPTQANGQNLTILFFYGGAWQEGSKDKYRFVAQAFAEEGYQVIVADYRVYPDVLFPGFMDDAARALAWVTDNIEQKIVLMGHSAGAHMAALLALDERYSQRYGVNYNKVVGLVGLSGPYDFLPLKSERLKTIFNAADDIQHTQPINFVSDNAPPALLVHGTDDTTVLPRNSKNLADKLRQSNIDVTLKMYEEASHAITVGALSIPFRMQLPVLQDVCAFLSTLKN